MERVGGYKKVLETTLNTAHSELFLQNSQQDFFRKNLKIIFGEFQGTRKGCKKLDPLEK